MGLIGKFVNQNTGEILKTAYVSCYNSNLQFRKLHDKEERRLYFEGKKELPDNYLEAGGYGCIGKYEVQGHMNVYYNRKARNENKEAITKLFFQVCVEEPNNFHQHIYKYIQKKYPDLKNSDGETSLPDAEPLPEPEGEPEPEPVNEEYEAMMNPEIISNEE